MTENMFSMRTQQVVGACLLVLLVVTNGCTKTEDVTIKATDVQYGDTPGKTVKEEIDDVKKSAAGKSHTHKKTEITDFSHTHKSSEVTDFSTAAVKAMGTKGNANALNHDKYGESDLAASATIKALQAEIAALKAKAPSAICPVGYTQDTTVTSFILCKYGQSEMVKVGDFWIDRYESLVVDAKAWNGGKCDGVGGTSYGIAIKKTDDFPASFPDSGDWTVPLYACSKHHVNASANMTWFQAQQACALAGKHLCTNGEWQAAASGTPDSTVCNINKQGTKGGGFGHSSDFPKCISNYGAVSMIGNVAEWVDWWGQAGLTWASTKTTAGPWPTGYGDAKDETIGVNGQAAKVASGSGVNGMPAAAFRGGHLADSVSAGTFNFILNAGPTVASYALGARCCRR